MRGIKTTDWVLAALMTLGGVFLMYENISAAPDADLAHPLSTQTWAIMPVFLLVTVPILWRRRNILVVTAVTIAATAVHVLAFGWVTRCGVELPLAFALAYAAARFGGSLRNQLATLAGIVVLLLVVLVRDASTGLEAMAIAIPGVALFYGGGLLVQTLLSRTNAPAAERVAA
jgi:hypothetical protein